MRTSRQTTATKSFYMEATVQSGSASAPDPANTGSVKWWYAGPNRWRWEMTSQVTTLVVVSDGTMIYTSDSATKIYYSVKVPEKANTSSPAKNFILGPVPGQTAAEYQRSVSPAVSPRKGDTILGHPTKIVRVGNFLGPATPLAGTDGGGVQRRTEEVWIDEAHMFALRNVVQTPDGRGDLQAEVTKLDLDPKLPDSTFAPPPRP